MAGALGVSQATVSRWECGLDIPSIEISHRITDLIATQIRDELAIKSRFIERLSSVQAIFDLDGICLEATSQGCAQAWPLFSRLAGRFLEPRMIGETRIAIDDADTRKGIIKGDIAMIVGVSTRHLDSEIDSAFKHRWISRFWFHGYRVLATLAYEPCDEATPVGIEEIFRLDDVCKR
ncbi:transcriptional regulator with XRE-family HTH domain [Labrys monachus]|uniref:Transcriptional regulator with XRE-family HTH domain n=2 Tax=Labrys monachus TaxID=217067 RepID=A0ABU0FGD4_9HYPH|nr:transcriptional regulator with XRE-family HTH domain [Labrys monachus]